MADAVVTIQDDELRALCSRLNGMALSSGDRHQLLTQIGAEMESQTKERFETKTNPNGGDWKDLEDSTKAFYLKKFGKDDPFDGGLLVRSGHLRDSVTFEAHSWDVIVGATVQWASLHQFGGTVYPFGNKKAKKVKVEARPYLGLGEDDRADIVWIINKFISERM